MKPPRIEKPVDGSNRSSSFDGYREWCQQLFNSLAEDGMWGVPRSLLTFRKRGHQLVLTERGDYPNKADQQADFLLIQKQFASAGIEVIDEA